MISQETGLRGSAQNYGGHDKKKASHAEKDPFGRENAELKNTPLKRGGGGWWGVVGVCGCSMSRCMTDCNYASPFYLAIRMRIRGSETQCGQAAKGARGGRLEFYGREVSLLRTLRMAQL